MLAWAVVVHAAGTLTSLHAVHQLSNEQAAQHIPVAFEATVTYYRNSDLDLFVQDGEDGIYVAFQAGAGFSAGDRVLVKGTTDKSFRPIITATSVQFVRHGTTPPPVPASFEQLNNASLDCRRISLLATVRSADIFGTGPLREVYLQTVVDGGYIDVAVNSTDESALDGLRDAQVEIAGVATAKFDQRLALAGSRINVQSLSDIKIIQPARIAPDSLPFTGLGDVYAAYRASDHSRRVRVRGTITYYQPGSTVVLQDGSKSLWVMTLTNQPLTIGDIAEVTGFPQTQNGFPALNMTEIRDTHVRAPITPLAVSSQDLGFGGNAFDLVATEGRLVRQVREAAVDEYVLESDGHVFSAIYRHPPTEKCQAAPAMKMLPLGSKVRVTGIGMFYTPDPFNGPVASDVLLRSDADITVLASPSLINTRNLLMFTGALLLVLFAVLLRGWSLERRIRRETATAAYLEQRRSLILEDISRAQPLHQIISKIIALLSYRLEGAPCWCTLDGGVTLGNPPAPGSGSALQIIREDIPSHSGKSAGSIFAAIQAGGKMSELGPSSVFNAAQLAALANETHGLYSDLMFRSEFDQLTKVHNRFSLEKRLQTLLDSDPLYEHAFGIIYVDLDDFKKVNDQFGHGVGDHFLQEVVRRFKQQLRPGDLLGRLGGDEFAIVIPAIASRSGLNEITLRLEHCFGDPFFVDGFTIPGSASMGAALFPEDGKTREALLDAADAAMYKAKNTRHGESAKVVGTV